MHYSEAVMLAFVCLAFVAAMAIIVAIVFLV
jgi:hypothetical protein